MTHIINPDERIYNDRLYIIHEPVGNHTISYGVYAGNEIEALETLVRHWEDQGLLSDLSVEETDELENDGYIIVYGNSKPYAFPPETWIDVKYL